MYFDLKEGNIAKNKAVHLHRFILHILQPEFHG